MFASVRGMRLRALLVAGLIAITPLSIIQRVCAQSGAANQWAWMGGIVAPEPNATTYWPGVYGTLGIRAAGNLPGSRDTAASWTDSSGHFWLFGGWGIDANGQPGLLNDLWEFNPSTNEWAWMGGSSTIGADVGQPGVYGSMGAPTAGNIPGGRSGAVTWIDGSGNLWLFGGEGIDASGQLGWLNDLWEFNPSTNEWAWMDGSSTVGSNFGQPGMYGTLAKPGTGNFPGGREEASSWLDSKGNFWLFGGFGYGSTPQLGWLNDLWEFNPSTNQWAWMSGSSTMVCGANDVGCGQPGVYGTLGQPAAANVPGSRRQAMSWTDIKGNLWLFGGDLLTAYNDLWEFNPSTNEWTWMGGSSTTDQPGVYGALGTPAAGNVPGARVGPSGWTDTSGNLWLFGGAGYDSAGIVGYLNDLWEFNPSTNEWAWMSGSSTLNCLPGSNNTVCDQAGVFGTLGIPAAGNVPGGRYGASNWIDGSGNLWLFGGYDYGDNGLQGDLNDLWKYQIAATSLPAAAAPTFNVPAGTFTTVQTVALSDATAGATIYYTTNASSPTPVWSAFSAPITVASTETIEAVAMADGYLTSALATAAYTINLPPAATPAFSLPSGTYTSAQTVAISDATPGATIYYTTDGVTTPTSGSAQYTGPITLWSSETIQAMAVAPYYSNSAVASAAYTINLPASSITATTITSSLNPSNVSEYVTFTATVAAVNVAAIPAGTVQFNFGGRIPASAPVALDSNGVATYTTAALFAGGAAVRAAYTPNSGSSFAPSVSAPLQQLVAGPCTGSSSTALTSSQNPSNPGQSVTFTATVAGGVFPLCILGGGPPQDSGTYAPSGIYGTVQFTVNGVAMGPQIPVGGGSSSVASYSTSTLSAGVDAITAQFIEGNGYVMSSTSNTVNQVVNGGALNPSFTIAPSSEALSIAQGGSGADTIAVTGAGGFSGSVMLVASGLPDGVTAGFSPDPATGASTLELTASSAADTGTFTVEVTGTSGALTASTAIALTVNAPASFTIAPSPEALSITQGGSSTDTIAVTGAGGFSDSVTLAASGLPNGVTASFGTNPTTGTSVLTLAAGSAATPGIYSVTVTGTSTSTAESAATIVQFAVDSAGASAPPFGASAATVAAGSTATYPVTLPSDVTSASVACMNLPGGATCSYSSTTNAVTIATSSTTPAGTYQVTVVFTETVAATASAGILLPMGLLPLLFLRRKLAARGIWTAACVGLILLAATALCTGCSGAGSTPISPPSTYQMTSSVTVSLTVQ